MQESLELQIKPTHAADNPEKILKELLQQEEKNLGIFISYYFKKDGAVAEHVKLRDEIKFSDKKSGKFTLEFDLIFFNACLNINEQSKDSLEISFVFDTDLRKVTLSGPYWPEREMDEI